MLAVRLDVEISTLGLLLEQSRRPAEINNTCMVFADTEIIVLLAAGVHPAEFVAGLQASVAARVTSSTRGSLDDPVVLIGGVALVPGMAQALESALARPVITAPKPL